VHGLVVAVDDLLGVLWRKEIVDGQADELVARAPDELLIGVIDENEFLRARVLDDERQRDVLDDRIEEDLGALELALGALALGAVVLLPSLYSLFRIFKRG